VPKTPSEDATPAALAAPGAREVPLTMTHSAMNSAYDQGEAVPLGSAVAWLIRYRESWWVVYEHGWLRVTDTVTAGELDQAAARLAHIGEAGVGNAPDDMKSD
jgi:hypothetical protein